MQGGIYFRYFEFMITTCRLRGAMEARETRLSPEQRRVQMKRVSSFDNCYEKKI